MEESLAYEQSHEDKLSSSTSSGPVAANRYCHSCLNGPVRAMCLTVLSQYRARKSKRNVVIDGPVQARISI